MRRKNADRIKVKDVIVIQGKQMTVTELMKRDSGIIEIHATGSVIRRAPKAKIDVV